jgi:hypothetical protein
MCACVFFVDHILFQNLVPIWLSDRLFTNINLICQQQKKENLNVDRVVEIEIALKSF